MDADPVRLEQVIRTCCATRSSTRRRTAPSPSPPRWTVATRLSGSATRGSASRPTSCRGSSSRSSRGRTRRRASRGSGSGSPSCAGSWRCTGEPSARRAGGPGGDGVRRAAAARGPAPDALAPAERGRPPAEQARRRADGAAGSRRQVLLVEDDPDVAATTADALELCGFAVRVEGDAEAGLRACLESRPDVALLDIGLPGRSGYELARDIRARLSGDGRPRRGDRLRAPGDRARAVEAGFDEHLVKPVGVDELCAAIERVAARGAVESSAA